MSKKSNEIITMDTADPFKRRIVLYESTWKGHILIRRDKKVDMITELSYIKQRTPIYWRVLEDRGKRNLLQIL